MFVGRKEEFIKLNALLNSKKAHLVCLYGRRRVGKSELIKKFGEKSKFLYFEGIEGERTPAQINSFVFQLREQINETEVFKLDLSSWEKIFSYLAEYLQRKHKGKVVIAFDEFQWMAAGQSKLVSLFKMFWDQHFKNKNVVIILCGSVASFMVKKVIKSKALYGRIDLELNIRPLKITEASQFFKQKNKKEIVNYLSLFGTIPKYLELIDQSKNFDRNVIDLLYTEGSYFSNEIEKIFYGHFKEPQTYKKIIESLINKGSLTVEEIAKEIKMSSGGGVKSYVDNLVLANFISPLNNFAQKNKKGKRYHVIDPYILFYFKCVSPYKTGINNGRGKIIYEKKVKPMLDSWLGLAFENLCCANSEEIIKAFGLEDEIVEVGTYLLRGNPNTQGVQIDLAFKFADSSLGIVEIKNSKNTNLNEYIDVLNKKKNKIYERENKSIYSYLITTVKGHYKEKTLDGYLDFSMLV